MKTLYIECNMGAAGDMLMAALLELLPGPEHFIEQMNGLGIPDVRIESNQAVKCGITGTQVSVHINHREEESHDIEVGHICGNDHAADHHPHQCDDHHCVQQHSTNHEHHVHHHHHTGLSKIQTVLAALNISGQVKADVLSVYRLIADAESKVHGKPVESVHFHEVGMMDAVADIVGVCLLMEELAPRRVVASPVHVGSGQVKCAHGILPVPAPATAYILQGVPTYGGQIRGELCTPTGAALLKHFVDAFGPQPMMCTERIGYGMGKKDFPAANCVRVFIGEDGYQGSDIVELSCNLDDMTGEEFGFALEILMENGALDAYIIPIQMKKSRPGQMLTCLCRPEDEDKMMRLMLTHTTTFGVRSDNRRRYTLERSLNTARTEFGDIRIKTGTGYGVVKKKPEYEDLARLAREKGVPLAKLKRHVDTDLT